MSKLTYKSFVKWLESAIRGGVHAEHTCSEVEDKMEKGQPDDSVMKYFLIFSSIKYILFLFKSLLKQDNHDLKGKAIIGTIFNYL